MPWTTVQCTGELFLIIAVIIVELNQSKNSSKCPVILLDFIS